MSPRAYVYPVVAALLLSVPAVGQALTVGVSLSQKNADGTVNGGTSVDATCTANLASGMLGTEVFQSGSATVTGGVFDGGATTVSLTGATTTLPVAVANSGTLRVDCSAVALLSTLTRTATGFAEATIVAPAAAPPQIASFDPAQATVLVGAPLALTAAATDPAGLGLTYAWTHTGGAFSDPASPSTVWTAPATQGTFTLTLTVTNTAGVSAKRTAVVTTALSLFQGGLSAAITYPRRVAATASGDLLAVDDLGNLFLLTKRGDARGSIPSLGATAVATGVVGGKEVAFVATRKRGILQFDPVTGRQQAVIPWRASSTISGLAYDGARNLLWAAIMEANRVVAFTASGGQAMVITQAEGRNLRNVADVALDAGSGTLWVAEKDGMTGNRVHAFAAADGAWLRSMVTSGSAAGQVTDTGGLAVEPGGRVFVSDAFYGTVQVMTSTGASVGTIGSKGDADGSLLHPRGLAVMANGDLAIANAWFNRIDRFGTGAALPTCAGDTDCDGLPDAWELAHGLNPNDASDALLDLDGDGLSNAEEFALGTDPSKVDTDGDGVADRVELLAGFDPLDPNDHRPMLVVGGPVEVPPGFVQIASTGTGPGTCVAAWRQLAGAAVTLRSPDTFSPSFVARRAGTYRFEGVAKCGAAVSAPAVAEVRVANSAPLADGGSTVVVQPGRTATLSAAFSSDANGDALAYAWEQIAGAPVTTSARGASLTVRPAAAGYYAFKVTATDASGAADEETFAVVAADDGTPTAIVATPVVSAIAGQPVTLDASASAPAGVTFSWAGPAELQPVATPSFTPPAPGRYAFEVTAWNGALRSAPARIVVLASAAAAPSASATAPTSAVVDAPVTLDGSASTAGGGGALSFAWTQLAGPAAGLRGADQAVATVVPFAPGAYAFALTVTEADGAVSPPAVVRFSVSAAGRTLPVAAVAPVPQAAAGQLVVLDGRASTGARNYRWTQVGGPWAVLEGAGAAVVFRAPVAGAYTFELVVDDGAVRSAPARVTVDVQ